MLFPHFGQAKFKILIIITTHTVWVHLPRVGHMENTAYNMPCCLLRPYKPHQQALADPKNAAWDASCSANHPAIGWNSGVTTIPIPHYALCSQALCSRVRWWWIQNATCFSPLYLSQ